MCVFILQNLENKEKLHTQKNENEKDWLSVFTVRSRRKNRKENIITVPVFNVILFKPKIYMCIYLSIVFGRINNHSVLNPIK